MFYVSATAIIRNGLIEPKCNCRTLGRAHGHGNCDRDHNHGVEQAIELHQRLNEEASSQKTEDSETTMQTQFAAIAIDGMSFIQRSGMRSDSTIYISSGLNKRVCPYHARLSILILMRLNVATGCEGTSRTYLLLMYF